MGPSEVLGYVTFGRDDGGRNRDLLDDGWRDRIDGDRIERSVNPVADNGMAKDARPKEQETDPGHGKRQMHRSVNPRGDGSCGRRGRPRVDLDVVACATISSIAASEGHRRRSGAPRQGPFHAFNCTRRVNVAL